MPIDYSKGKIYRIYSPSHLELGEYIGSTTQSLSKRFSKHNDNYKRYKEGKSKYTASFDLLDFEDVRIELIENYSCASKEELERKEGEHIRGSGKYVNRHIAGRTKKEYREEHREEILEKKKKYREEHREEILEKKKKYREEHREEIKERAKKYREEHREEILEKKKKYREDQHEEIEEYKKKYLEEHKEELEEYRKKYQEELRNSVASMTLM